jgi:hypothetical protein
VRRSLRQPLAASLAGVAALALVIAPVLHAEAHRNEAAQADRERAAAFERIFEIVFSGAYAGRRAELQHALTSVLGRRQAGAAHVQAAGEPPHRHESDGGAPRHSHGQGPLISHLVEQSQGPPCA